MIEPSIIQSASSEAITAVPLNEMVEYFVNSMAAGLLLSVVTIWATQNLPATPEVSEPGPAGSPSPEYVSKMQQLENRVNAVTVAFLCIGMTGVMLLVSNSLARAFAVGAAISLVRFRIRLDKPGLSTALFFAVLVGMACGAGNVNLGWIMTGLFVAVQASLVFISGRWMKNELPAKNIIVNSAPQNVATTQSEDIYPLHQDIAQDNKSIAPFTIAAQKIRPSENSAQL